MLAPSVSHALGGGVQRYALRHFHVVSWAVGPVRTIWSDPAGSGARHPGTALATPTRVGELPKTLSTRNSVTVLMNLIFLSRSAYGRSFATLFSRGSPLMGLANSGCGKSHRPHPSSKNDSKAMADQPGPVRGRTPSGPAAALCPWRAGIRQLGHDGAFHDSPRAEQSAIAVFYRDCL